MKRNALFTMLMLPLISIFSQVQNPVKWEFETKSISDNEYYLIFHARIESNWHLYGREISGTGPVPTSFYFTDTSEYQLIGDVENMISPEKSFDPNFKMEIPLFDREAKFRQKVRIPENKVAAIKGYVEFMSCDDSQCLPPKEVEFSFTLPEGAIAETAEGDGEQEEERTLWGIFLISLLGGLGGIFTPCVYPIIPLTVSFFMKDKGARAKVIGKALFFGFSIILIYTLIGLLVGLTGVDFTGSLASHWLSNTIFFLIFMAFAFSFLGMFEIMLPSGLANKVDQRAEKGGFLGPFFMALATVIISFSCTGPIVGVLLGQATQGEIIKPVVGMFGFSLVFAMPFTLFAIFPSMLNNLPKSGGWLNEVKVVIAFILIALSLSFISNIDQVYHLGILSRKAYLAIWISNFTLMGLYLLGKIRMPHDSDINRISVVRLIFTIATFAFVIYLLPGMFGAPLHSLSSMLPPEKSSTTVISQPAETNTTPMDVEKGACSEIKYSDILSLPHGIKGYFDYEQGLKCAKEKNKPLFVVFKGHSCSKCKEMEAKIWSDPKVLNILKNDFVVVALYTDDRKKLPRDEWRKSPVDGEWKKTMGKKFSDLQIAKFNTNTIPFHVIFTPEGEVVETMGYTSSVDEFIGFLSKADDEKTEEDKTTKDTFKPAVKQISVPQVEIN